MEIPLEDLLEQHNSFFGIDEDYHSLFVSKKERDEAWWQLASTGDDGKHLINKHHYPYRGESFEAEDYGVGAVWMADSYDPAIHGNTIPTGSVKRFLDKIPMGQMFHVDFVKSNGDIREMDAFFNKPFDTDSMVANVMERTGTGAVFKRFRVDRVVGLYRI